MAQNNQHSFMAMDSVDKEFRKGIAGMACICSMMSVASGGKTWKAGMTGTPSVWNHLEQFFFFFGLSTLWHVYKIYWGSKSSVHVDYNIDIHHIKNENKF